MIKSLVSYKRLILGLVVTVSLVSAFAFLGPSPASAQKACDHGGDKKGPAACDPFKATNAGGGCDPKQGGKRVFGFPFWYEYLDGEKIGNACRPHISQPADIWLVVAALFQILLRVAGIAAVGFVIYGGFKYIMSRGQPGDIAAAKETLTNAIVGLVLTIISARLIGFIAGKFSGSTNNDFLLPNVTAGNGAIQTILTVAIQLAAVFAVMFIAWGGITYARSNGDPNTIKEAKDTILYAVVGLVVAIFAQAIIYFVFNRLD